MTFFSKSLMVLLISSIAGGAIASRPTCVGDISAYGGGFTLAEIEKRNYDVFDQNLGDVSESCREFMIARSRNPSCLKELSKYCRGKNLNLAKRKGCTKKYQNDFTLECKMFFFEKFDAESCADLLREKCPKSMAPQDCRLWGLKDGRPLFNKCEEYILEDYLAERIHQESLPKGVSENPCDVDFKKLCPAATKESEKDICLTANYLKFSPSCTNYRLKRRALMTCKSDIIKACWDSNSTLTSCLVKVPKQLEKNCAPIEYWHRLEAKP